MHFLVASLGWKCCKATVLLDVSVLVEERCLAVSSFLGVRMKVLPVVSFVATISVGESFSKAAKALYAVEKSALGRTSIS